MKTEKIKITEEKNKTSHYSLERVYELFEELFERIKLLEIKAGI